VDYMSNRHSLSMKRPKDVKYAKEKLCLTMIWPNYTVIELSSNLNMLKVVWLYNCSGRLTNQRQYAGLYEPFHISLHSG